MEARMEPEQERLRRQIRLLQGGPSLGPMGTVVGRREERPGLRGPEESRAGRWWEKAGLPPSSLGRGRGTLHREWGGVRGGH